MIAERPSIAARRLGRRWGLAVLAAFATSAALSTVPALAQVPPIERGATYAQARARMLAAGFAPYRLRTYRLLARPCLGREDFCRAYPEAADCAGTGLGDCLFLFTKGASLIVQIHTVGEGDRPEQLTVRDVRRVTQAELDKSF